MTTKPDNAPEPKEPDVVPLDDPTVPYSLVPVGDGSGAGAVAGPPDSVTLDWLAVVGKMNTKIRELEAELDRVRAAAATQPKPEHIVAALKAAGLLTAYAPNYAAPVEREAEEVVRQVLGAVPASPWQPIATCPEGWFLAASVGKVHIACCIDGELCDVGADIDTGEIGLHEPAYPFTHWMPLPDPPAPHRSDTQDDNEDQRVSR